MEWVVMVLRLRAGSCVTGSPCGVNYAASAPSPWAGQLGGPGHRGLPPGHRPGRELAREATGGVLVLDARARDEASGVQLEAAFNQARAAEWVEFGSECDKFVAEIAKEQRIGKLTLAELDEEEHSLERLRRWWRDLKARDEFGLAAGGEAEVKLKACTEVLEDYAEQVYTAVHAPAGHLGETGDG